METSQRCNTLSALSFLIIFFHKTQTNDTSSLLLLLLIVTTRYSSPFVRPTYLDLICSTLCHEVALSTSFHNAGWKPYRSTMRLQPHALSLYDRTVTTSSWSFFFSVINNVNWTLSCDDLCRLLQLSGFKQLFQPPSIFMIPEASNILTSRNWRCAHKI